MIENDAADIQCLLCRTAGPGRLELLHEPSGDRIRLCRRCLRSSPRAKAAPGDARPGLKLGGDAVEKGWRVWRSGDVVFLLPTLTRPEGVYPGPQIPPAADSDGR